MRDYRAGPGCPRKPPAAPRGPPWVARSPWREPTRAPVRWTTARPRAPRCQLGLDNTATSGAITYTINPAANSGRRRKLRWPGPEADLNTGASLNDPSCWATRPCWCSRRRPRPLHPERWHTQPETALRWPWVARPQSRGATIHRARRAAVLTAGSIHILGRGHPPRSTGPAAPSMLTLTGNTTLGAGTNAEL